MTVISGRESSADIRAAVRRRVSQFSGVPIQNLEDEHTLHDDLRMSHQSCVALSRSLDAFVKERNPRGQIQARDVDNDEATVGSTTKLVDKQIKSEQ